jgi:hypothetical protein
VATRLFLRKLKTELRLPVLGLVDADPYGLKILSVYMSGSKNMSYDSANLTTPDIKWLGIRPSDLDRYGIPDQCRLPMTPGDLKVGAELLKEEFITSNPAWVKELQAMCAMKVKAEIQSLSSFDFQCVGRGARRRAAAAHTCRAAPTPTRARVPLRFTRRRRRRRAGTSRTRTCRKSSRRATGFEREIQVGESESEGGAAWALFFPTGMPFNTRVRRKRPLAGARALSLSCSCRRRRWPRACAPRPPAPRPRASC